MLHTKDGKSYKINGLNLSGFIDNDKKNGGGDLKKAHMSSNFSSYGSEKNLTFSKKGSDIKKALDRVVSVEKSKIVTNKQMMEMKLSTLKTLGCDLEPEQKPNSYELFSYNKETENNPGFELKTFNWDQKEAYYGKINNLASLRNGSESEASAQDKETIKVQRQILSLMEEYNDLVNRIRGSYADIEICEVMKRNLEDNKNYDLTVKQLKSLQM